MWSVGAGSVRKVAMIFDVVVDAHLGLVPRFQQQQVCWFSMARPNQIKSQMHRYYSTGDDK